MATDVRGLVSILAQEDIERPGELTLLAYCIRPLSRIQGHYAGDRKQLLAAVFGVSAWQHWLQHEYFIIIHPQPASILDLLLRAPEGAVEVFIHPRYRPAVMFGTPESSRIMLTARVTAQPPPTMLDRWRAVFTRMDFAVWDNDKQWITLHTPSAHCPRIVIRVL